MEGDERQVTQGPGEGVVVRQGEGRRADVVTLTTDEGREEVNKRCGVV